MKFQSFVSSAVHEDPPIFTASYAALCDDGVALMLAQGMPGFSLGQKIEGKCGMRASMTAELVFDGVEASASGVLFLPEITRFAVGVLFPSS